MKIKIIGIVILASFQIIAFTAGVKAKQLTVIATTAELGSIAEFVGGDFVKVTHLTDGRDYPHAVVPRPSWITKVRKADMIIINGMDMDMWAASLIEASRNPALFYEADGYLDISKSIPERLEVPTTPKIDMSMGDVHPQGNPHYMLDPLNAKLAARAISDRMAYLLPEKREYFEANAQQFNARIDEKMQEWNEKVHRIPNKKLVTYHKLWAYFANRFGLEIVAELEPKPGIPPSVRHLQDVVSIIGKERPRVILIASYFDDKPAQFVAERTGVKVVEVPVSLYAEKHVTNYFELIDHIVEQLLLGAGE